MGGICKDVLHAVADPDIQIRGGGGREGERGGSHPDPEIRGMLSLKKKNFRLSRPQFGLKTFGPSPRSDTDMAAV